MELGYKKIVCDGGHELILLKEALQPQFCPTCNRRYDRRRIRPIPCLKDGTVPNEEADLLVKAGQSGYKGENGSCSGAHPKSVYDNSDENASMDSRRIIYEDEDENIPIRRRRRSYGDEGDDISARRRRPVYEETEEHVSAGHRRGMEESDQEEYYPRGKRSNSIQIRSGSDFLEINSEGAYLGRSESGCGFLSLNPLVSRRHSFVRMERNGNLQIQDERSLNGTFVDMGNGRKKLSPGEKVSLSCGSKFWLANQLFIVEK